MEFALASSYSRKFLGSVSVVDNKTQTEFLVSAEYLYRCARIPHFHYRTNWSAANVYVRVRDCSPSCLAQFAFSSSTGVCSSENSRGTREIIHTVGKEKGRRKDKEEKRRNNFTADGIARARVRAFFLPLHVTRYSFRRDFDRVLATTFESSNGIARKSRSRNARAGCDFSFSIKRDRIFRATSETHLARISIGFVVKSPSPPLSPLSLSQIPYRTNAKFVISKHKSRAIVARQGGATKIQRGKIYHSDFRSVSRTLTQRL